jgi:hypothetical protein
VTFPLRSDPLPGKPRGRGQRLKGSDSVKTSLSLILMAATLAAGCSDDDDPNDPSENQTTFFVSSEGNATGNLGGLGGADAKCERLAGAAGLSTSRTWRAYLSASGNDARSRIGSGPWRNAAGTVVAQDLNELHSRPGDAALFVDERGTRINGQWSGSPTPVQHDILTGSTADGRFLAGMTCNDWTSDSASQAAQVGHSDGLGPNMNGTPPLNSWNSAHANESCANTAPRGGSGRIYCFATK